MTNLIRKKNLTNTNATMIKAKKSKKTGRKQTGGFAFVSHFRQQNDKNKQYLSEDLLLELKCG